MKPFQIQSQQQQASPFNPAISLLLSSSSLLYFYIAEFAPHCCGNKLVHIYCLNTINVLPCSAGDQKSEIGLTGLNSRCQQGYTHSEGPRKLSVLLPFPASGGLHSVTHGPFLNFHNYRCSIFICLSLTLTLALVIIFFLIASLLPLFFLLWIFLWLHWAHSVNPS